LIGCILKKKNNMYFPTQH